MVVGNWVQIGEKPLTKRLLLPFCRKRVDQGITFFDTADVYGDGKSESLIGEFLATTKAPVKITTKYGRRQGMNPKNYTKDTLRA